MERWGFNIRVGCFIPMFSSHLQVKLWNTTSGFCFVTFPDHSAGVTGVCFNASGKVVVSCSLDGTVRAFDLHRSVMCVCKRECVCVYA